MLRPGASTVYVAAAGQETTLSLGQFCASGTCHAVHDAAVGAEVDKAAGELSSCVAVAVRSCVDMTTCYGSSCLCT